MSGSHLQKFAKSYKTLTKFDISKKNTFAQDIYNIKKVLEWAIYIKEKARPTITNENFHEITYKAMDIITV